jgi:hypothetical protein
MTTANKPPLQAWTCVKCGAALPAEAGTGVLAICGYCGTPFKLPVAQTRRGGVTIAGGSVTIGGDIVGGSKHVIVTSEVPAATLWDEPDDSDDDEGVSIDGDGIQVYGDVIGGSVVKIMPPATAVKVAPVAVAVPEVVVEPASKLGWREKVKRLFAK